MCATVTPPPGPQGCVPQVRPERHTADRPRLFQGVPIAATLEPAGRAARPGKKGFNAPRTAIDTVGHRQRRP